MDSEENNKRKRGKQSDEDDARREKKSKKDDEDNSRKEKKSRRARSKSKSPLPRDRTSKRRRKHSRSRSPEASHSVKLENEQDNSAIAEPKPPERKRKETDMLNTKTGGAYIPPARLRMMQAQITDKTSVAYQRLAWEALKKSVHGHINKINIGNIGIIIKELLKENIVRGRGLLCRSVIQAQAASPTFTNVYAALVAAVNSRFPNIGELLLKRLVIQFKRGFKRNDKPICISSASFIAHLVNQRVAHEILALELLTLLVESPTDDSVEVAISFLKECGQKLTEVSSKGVNAIFEMLRNILHEGQLDKRVQYMIEVMFQVWKDGFKDHPALIEDLELVPEEEQFTHLLMLDDATDPQDILNVFKFDDKYEENEQKYKTLSKEILGSDAESGEEDGSGESGSEESDEEEEEETEKKGGVTIIDNTETNLVALRRTIYLTINSSLDFEECAHKLMKMQLKPGQEVELCHMFLDCCAEQRTYEKFYGLLAQRFCNINRIYIGPFEEIFKDSYSTAHRLDTNRLRNVSKFFAHLLFTDSISWEVMDCVKLNEEDTTSSSRIYIKILFQELAEYMGLKKLNDRLKDPTLQQAFSGVFPRDNPKNTRFSINFFTSIGLGGLTDELREHLKQMPKNVPPPITEINVESESSSDSSSSSPSSEDSSSDSSSSDSDEETTKKKKKDKTSGEKSRGEKNNEAEEAKKDTERWGHDGFYDTYGKDARRTEVRPDRNNVERNLDYARSDKDSTRSKQTERDRENSRSERNRYERRDRDNSRSSQSERDNSRSNHSERDNSRTDKYERNRESSRVDKERYRSRSDRVERDRADFKSERDKDNFAIPRQVPRNDKYRESNRANDEENQQRDHRRGYDNEEQSTRKRDDGKERRKNYEINDSKCQGHKESGDDKYIKRNNEETRSKRDKENRYVEAVDGPKDRGRKKHDSSNEEDNKSDEKYNKKSKDKKKKKDKESRSSDDDSKSRKKHKKKAKDSRKNREKDDSSDDDSSSSSDDSRRTPPIDQTGWDIRRESSITKEIHGRYWDSHKFDDKPKGKTERNKSPEKTYYGNRR